MRNYRAAGGDYFFVVGATFGRLLVPICLLIKCI